MKKPLQKKMLGYYIHKDSFLNFFCTLQFLNFFRLFFIQLIFMYVVGKYRKHSGSESLPLLRHCRDPIESKPSSRNIKILKFGDGYVIAANLFSVHCVKEVDGKKTFNLIFSTVFTTS